MILDGQVLGRPLISYKDTQSAIEALTGVVAGMTAYATDTTLTGYYTGSAWVWGVGSSGSVILALPQYHFFVGGSSGSAVDAGTGITYNPSTSRLSLDNVQWDLTPTPVAPSEGLMYWNSDDGTLNLGMPGGDVNLQLGQEMLLRAKNETGSTITNGQLVYISGGTGSNAIVSLAQANSEMLSASTIGMATEDILNNQFGYITLSGMVRDVNTSGSSAGTMLYLSPSVVGGYTGNKPVAPNHSVCIGTIIRSHMTEGVIFVRVDNGFEISELHDVLITSPATNQVLQYNSSGSYWQNSINTLSIAGNSTVNGSLVGNITGGGTVATAGFTLTVPATGVVALLGVANTFTLGPNTFQSGADANKGLIIKGNSATQSANLFEAQNSAGTAKFAIGPTGTAAINDIGTAAPTSNALLTLTSQNTTLAATKYALQGEVRITNTALNINGLVGLEYTARYSGSAAMNAELIGGRFIASVGGTASNTATNVNALVTRVENFSATAVASTARGLYIESPSGTGTITNYYGIYVDAATRAGLTNAYSIYTNGGQHRLGDLVAIVGRQDATQLTVTGHTTQTNTVAQITRNDANTNAVGTVLTLTANSTGVPAAGFGLRAEYQLESSTTASQTAATEDVLWTDATHATRTVLKRGTTTGNATQSGYYGSWAHNAVSNTSITIIPNGTGDVASVGTFLFSVKDNTSGTTNGGVVVLNPGGGAVSLLSDSTDTLQITCAADGSVTIARSAGTHTFSVSIWGSWQ